jgi:DNA-binding NarL/FixJ family response regulator
MAELKRLRVLIADDHLPLAVALQRLLSIHCDVVGTVADCGSLMEATKRLDPDIVLLDLNLPSGSSLVACQEIIRMAPHTQVIVLTGGLDSTLRPHVLAAGAAAFIDKSAVGHELLSAIARTQTP